MHRTYTDAQIAGGLQLISEALLVALFAATFVAEFTAARFPEMTFMQRFAYGFWRFTLPACLFSSAIYWFNRGVLR